MGGGTGSGAIEIAARIAKSLNIPSLSIVTIPFAFEAGRRQHNAAEAVAALRPFTDTLITILMTVLWLWLLRTPPWKPLLDCLMISC